MGLIWTGVRLAVRDSRRAIQEATAGAQAGICLLEQSPAPYIHRLWATALGRNKCRCCLVEIVGGHSDSRIARHGGLDLQEGGPQLAQRRVSPVPALDPSNRLSHVPSSSSTAILKASSGLLMAGSTTSCKRVDGSRLQRVRKGLGRSGAAVRAMMIASEVMRLDASPRRAGRVCARCGPTSMPCISRSAMAGGREGGGRSMNTRTAHDVWTEQCEAAQRIRVRFGLRAAFDDLVGEKLMNFASAASRHPDFARELPRFISEVRCMFTPDQIRAHLAQMEREQNEQNGDISADNDPLRESPAAALEAVRQFMMIKDVLTVTRLGTSL